MKRALRDQSVATLEGAARENMIECRRMAGIPPGPENLIGAFLNEQSDAAQTASRVDGKEFGAHLANAIQRFKKETTAEDADLATVARLDDEAGITLGMLDADA